MALKQVTYLYEILVRFNEAGLQGCQRIDVMQIVDDATAPPTVISTTLQGAVEISQEEAADLIYDAELAPPPPEEDSDAE